MFVTAEKEFKNWPDYLNTRQCILKTTHHKQKKIIGSKYKKKKNSFDCTLLACMLKKQIITLLPFSGFLGNWSYSPRRVIKSKGYLYRNPADCINFSKMLMFPYLVHKHYLLVPHPYCCTTNFFANLSFILQTSKALDQISSQVIPNKVSKMNTCRESVLSFYEHIEIHICVVRCITREQISWKIVIPNIEYETHCIY